MERVSAPRAPAGAGSPSAGDCCSVHPAPPPARPAPTCSAILPVSLHAWQLPGDAGKEGEAAAGGG
jgi:hypothetical protein